MAGSAFVVIIDRPPREHYTHTKGGHGRAAGGEERALLTQEQSSFVCERGAAAFTGAFLLMGRVLSKQTHAAERRTHIGPPLAGFKMQARFNEQVHIFISVAHKATPRCLQRRCENCHAWCHIERERVRSFLCVAQILNFILDAFRALMEIYLMLLPKQTAGSFPGGSCRCHGRMRDGSKNANLLLLFLRVCRTVLFFCARE